MMMGNSVDDRMCLPNMPHTIGEERSSHILSTRRESNISQHPSASTITATCPNLSRLEPFSNAATTPVSIMSTHWSCSESAPLHNRVNGPFDDPRQNIQSTPSSSENSPTMSSCRFSEVGEDSCHTDNPRYQKHVSDMRTFLESGPIRQLEDPQRKEGIRPHEACPINDRSEPLPNIINFSALLHGDESVTEEGTTSPTNNTTSDLNEMMHNKFTLENDSATGDLDQEQSTGTLEAQQFFHFEAGHAYGHLPEGFQSPGDRRLSASDSGFFDERGASAQQSPFIGSPEMYLQLEWSRVGESDRQDAWTSPQTLASTSFEETYCTPGSSEPLRFFPPIESTSHAAMPRKLTDDAVQIIMVKVLQPMMENENLSKFWQILSQAVDRLERGSISSLRDLEKAIVRELGHQSRECTAASYIKFCFEFLQRSRHLWDLLSDDDLHRPNDQPYHKGYFPDAMHEVIGIAQVTFRIHSDELNSIVESIQRSVATPKIDSARGQSKGVVPHSAGTRTGTGMLKRQQSEPPDAGRSRKKPKVCDNNSKSKESPERSSASATAVNRPSKMQPPPPPPSSQDTGSASSILHQMFSTNSLQQHPTTYLTASVACETDNINFPFSPPVYDPTSTPTSEMDYQQIQQPQTSTVSQAMQQCGGGLTQSCSTPHSSSDSPSTVAQSDESASPSSARRRHVVRQTEESHPCEKCNKQFPRACDLKKHRKTHDRPYKCTVSSCNYSIMGFSAEKDRDRHFHDKHDKDAPRQKCHYNCSYSSPRESNVKQHMEKAHGYIYVRTKTVQKSKSPATPAKSTTRGNVAPRRPRQDRQTSSSQPPPSVTSSVQNTPVVMDSKYPSSDSTPSPLFDIDTLSPETLREEPSPALESVQSFFPPLPKSPNSLAVISPRFINQTLDAQHQMADTFEPSPHHSLFTDPPGALEAMRMQQNSGDEVPSYPHMNVMHWGFGPIAKTDPPLGGESPDSDFADNFLRDAPDSIMNQLGASAPFDPELPVVTNSVYDESRDMFLG